MTARVLVVDDVLPNVKLLEAKLSREYFQVLTAMNGKEALAKIEADNPDIVLLDVMMPEMDGFETTHAIRGIRRYRNLPIIALTAKAMKGDREKCLEAGLSDYITKPVDTDKLLSLIRYWLDRRVGH